MEVEEIIFGEHISRTFEFIFFYHWTWSLDLLRIVENTICGVLTWHFHLVLIFSFGIFDFIMFKNDILLMKFMDVMLILLKELPRQLCEAFGNHYHNLINCFACVVCRINLLVLLWWFGCVIEIVYTIKSLNVFMEDEPFIQLLFWIFEL
jgi:hypothetical protein